MKVVPSYRYAFGLNVHAAFATVPPDDVFVVVHPLAPALKSFFNKVSLNADVLKLVDNPGQTKVEDALALIFNGNVLLTVNAEVAVPVQPFNAVPVTV